MVSTHVTGSEARGYPVIKVLIPYFGAWPVWFRFFLESCAWNPHYRWVIFTDCGVPAELPANVRIVQLSFAEYCVLVSEQLGIGFAPSSPYKLCDIKPALAEVHADELEGVDFWAFGDIDVIYGDLAAYFTAERLAGHDLYSTHARRISGHFTLVRNRPDMNSAFRRIDGWQDAFESKEHRAFDERAYSKVFLRHKNSPGFVRTFAKALDPWLRRAEFVEAYSTPNAGIAWRDGSSRFPQVWTWSRGRLSNDLDRKSIYPYFHFMTWKHEWRKFACMADANAEGSLGDFEWSISCNGIDLVELTSMECV